MTEDNEMKMRIEALSQAVRVTLAQGGEDGATVDRAVDYQTFLMGRTRIIGALAVIHARASDSGKLWADGWKTIVSHYEPIAEALAATHGTTPSGLHSIVAKGEVTADDLDRAIAFVLTGPTDGE